MSIEVRAYEALVGRLDTELESVRSFYNKELEELYAKYSFCLKLLDEGGRISQEDFIKEIDKANEPRLADLRRHAEESMFY